MQIKRKVPRALLSWLSLGALVVLCAVLGVLQYRWLGEVSLAERDRLRGNLQGSLDRLSREFNREVSVAAAALMPVGSPPGGEIPEQAYTERYHAWQDTARNERLFRSIFLWTAGTETPVLRRMDLETGAFSQAEWPAGWDGLRQRLAGRAAWEPPRMPRADFGELPFVLVVPRFGRPPEPGPPQRTPPVRREMTFLILEVNPDYVRESMMPELVQRYFGSGDALEYQVEIVTRDNPQAVVYQSEGFGMQRIGGSADASAPILELQFDQFERRRGPLTPGDMGRRRMGGGPEGGRWLLAARHRAGSLDAVVARARWKNLAVTSLVLLLMLAAAGTLIRATRRAQQLAGLQMDFVTGVSHELRTPLTVIRTAAYNLRGKMAQNPAQVERYGGLIQKESEKLTGLVEQVLQFASLKAGKILRGKESLSVETLVEESLESSKAVLETARCKVERRIEPELPAIHGDPLALRLAVENLLGNAAKYGADSGGWIGLECSRVAGRNGPEVEIAVTDRGPGIPREEQGRIFDAFYRGRRAIEDQVHGTGLGLSLVKGIVEAHGGTVTVESEPGRGSRFAIRVPAAESEGINEFTDSAG